MKFFLNILLITLCFSSLAQNPWYNLVTYNSLESTKEMENDQIEKLILKGEKLTSFPEELKKFTSLKYLDLTKNKIGTIPDWISELHELECLILNKNQIDSLPPSLFLLTNLKVLQLGSNNIKVIPDEIEKLSNLEILDLWNNEIERISDGISKLEKLRKLDLRAILYNQEQQDYIQGLLPNTKIDFDPPCNCGY